MKRKFKKNTETILLQNQVNNIQKTVLPNGITILTEQVPNVQSFALGITVNVGSRNDYPDYSGLAHFVEHASFKHTAKRSAKQIAEQAEAIGAYLNAYTTKEITCYYARALLPNFSTTFDLLLDITLSADFPQAPIEKEKKVIIEEIKSIEDDPEELIIDVSDSIIFQGNPIGNPIAGTIKSVEKINNSILKDFHHNYYSANNLYISFAGNLEHSYVVEVAEKLLPPLKNSNTSILRSNVTSYKSTIKHFRKSFAQAHIVFCKPVPGLNSQDRHKIQVINTLLGDGMSSRLYQALREKNGWAYNIYSTLNQYSDAGAIYIYASIDKKKLFSTQKLIENELAKLTTNGIDKKELHRGREQVKSSLIMSLESLSSKMQYLAKTEILYKNYESITDVIYNIDQLTLDDINYSIQEYLKMEDWSVVIFDMD